VLVTLGGGDPDNVTLKVIQALQQLDSPVLETRIVVGSANPHLEMLNHAVQRSNCNFQLLTDVSDMPEQMAWADIAISGAGSTSWELAFMGLPSCNIILADNQLQVATTLHEQGVTINLGWFHSLNLPTFVQIIGDLSADQQQRFAMSSQGRLLVDGNGMRSVVAALHEYSGWRQI
jgi:spore coat polysaccharide biosynthesis predicted glycosyltransferase SpsG